MLRDTILQVIRKHRDYAATSIDRREQALADDIAQAVAEEVLAVVRLATVKSL